MFSVQTRNVSTLTFLSYAMNSSGGDISKDNGISSNLQSIHCIPVGKKREPEGEEPPEQSGSIG